jgi:hypothetical protein
MGDPRSYSAYLEDEVGSYSWDDEPALPAGAKNMSTPKSSSVYGRP